MAKKRGLGRGIDALLSGVALTQTAENVLVAQDSVKLSTSETPLVPEHLVAQDVTVKSSDQFQQIPITELVPNPFQPRQHMDDDALTSLADSIRNTGLIQPIVVRPVGTEFEIIAGERRWRASKRAGLKTIPCVVKPVSDEITCAMALIENIQREDLNPLEQAQALQRLQQEFSLTHQQVADAIGKSRVMVTNLLRLLSLETSVKEYLRKGELNMGHARAMLSLPDHLQAQVAATVVAQGLTVRQTEALVLKLQNTKDDAKQLKEIDLDPDVKRLQQNLSERLGAAVTIKHAANGRGKLTIAFSSLDELDGILRHIQ